MSWVEMRLRELKRLEEYRRNAKLYLNRVKEAVLKRDRGARVLVFGSFVEGSARKDSDIDVLIVTRLAKDPWERARLRAEVNELLGEGNPFELHIVTDEEFREWYLKFLKKFEEV